MPEDGTQDPIRVEEQPSGALTIHTLLTIIRGFSNQITVRSLSQSLDISYSTLARCKSGVWPRSIKPEAMRQVLDDCRQRYFDGDGMAQVASIMLYLQTNQVEYPSALLTAQSTHDYDTFINALIVCARTPEAADELEFGTIAIGHSEDLGAIDARAAAPSDGDRNSESGNDFSNPAKIAASPAVQGEARQLELILVLPLILVLLIGLFGPPLSRIVAWSVSHHLAFLGVSLMLADLPAIAGLVIDAPIAWHTYKREHPEASWSPEVYAHVAKWGLPDGRQTGAGRFDPTLSHLLWQTLCNVSGMLCCVSMLTLCSGLPNFMTFMAQHEWDEFLKVCVAVACYITHTHMREELRGARDVVYESYDSPVVNPDNYLPNRIHI